VNGSKPHRNPGGFTVVTQPYQPQSQPQPAQPQPEPAKKKRRIIWIGIVLSILWLASCGAIIDAIGGDDDPATTAQPPPSAATTTEALPPPAEETTTEPEPEPTSCKLLKKSQLAEIAPGMDSSTRVKLGVWVPLSGDYQFGFNQVVALRLTGGSVATFATENLGKADHGLLMAVNGPARKHYTWGAAVRPGSPMDDDLQAVKASPEYAEAVDCARGQA
jgi:hypothetical protein